MELDPMLLQQAKALAVKRRTTLQAILEHALRRELARLNDSINCDSVKFQIGPLGLPVLKPTPEQRETTHEDLKKLEEECDEEEFQRALRVRGA